VKASGSPGVPRLGPLAGGQSGISENTSRYIFASLTLGFDPALILKIGTLGASTNTSSGFEMTLKSATVYPLNLKTECILFHCCCCAIGRIADISYSRTISTAPEVVIL